MHTEINWLTTTPNLKTRTTLLRVSSTMWTMLPCCHANMIGLLIHQSQSSEPCCFLSKDFTIILSSPSCSLDHLFNDISHSWLMLLLPHFANQFWLVEGTPYSCFVFDKTIFVTTYHLCFTCRSVAFGLLLVISNWLWFDSLFANRRTISDASIFMILSLLRCISVIFLFRQQTTKI